MKKIVPVFVILAGLCWPAIVAQTYHPFPTSGAIWNTVGDNVFTNAGYEFRFGVYGDTVIDAETWTKVYSIFDTVLISETAVYFGAIREDASRKVWFLQPGFETTILYDFGAEPGDTIWYPYGGALCGDTFGFWPQTPHYKTVVSVDSLLMASGEYRKRWNMAGSGIAGQWIEGIGSISWFGLFNPLISDIALCGDSYDFACFVQDGEVLYVNNVNCETCFCSVILSWSDLFDNRDNRLAIFPNPARSEIVVSFISGEGPYNLMIADMTGREIWSAAGVRSEEVKIEVSTYRAGQYILFVRDRNNQVVRQGKFIVN